jgi:hypothetical protein
MSCLLEQNHRNNNRWPSSLSATFGSCFLTCHCLNRHAVPPQVAALLQQLREQEEREPGSKAVVFSTWPRVLGLVSEALTAHKVVHASLAAPSLKLSDRQEAIIRCGSLLLPCNCGTTG